MKILLALILFAASALAQSKPKIEQEIAPWDRLARDNITVSAQTAAGAFKTEKKYFSKTIDVLLSPVGSNANPATVELFIVVRRDGFAPIARRVGTQEAELGAGRFTFMWNGGNIAYRGDEIRGWLVRVVRDGRIAGFAASSGPCEELAENPALLSDMLAQQWQRK